MIPPTGLPTKGRRGRRSGFTTIEMILVVVFVSIVAGFAIPNLKTAYIRVQLRQTCEDLAGLMRYAQSQAVVWNRRMRLEFNPTFTQYWLSRQSQGLDTVGDEAFERIPGRLGQLVNIPVEITIASPAPVLYFYPDGTMDRNYIELCHIKECLRVSTKEQRGYVHVLETSVAYP